MFGAMLGADCCCPVPTPLPEPAPWPAPGAAVPHGGGVGAGAGMVDRVRGDGRALWVVCPRESGEGGGPLAPGARVDKRLRARAAGVTVKDVGTAGRGRGRVGLAGVLVALPGPGGKGQGNGKGVGDYPHGRGSHCSNLAPNQIVGTLSGWNQVLGAGGSQWTWV